MYFKNFNQLTYDFTVPTDKSTIVETITDIMQRVQLKISDTDLDILCDRYIVADNVKPEQIAANLYNDPYKHWTVLYINGITNFAAEWPLSQTVLQDYVTKKYGAGNENNIHHYEKQPEGVTIDPDFCLSVYGEDAIPVTNSNFEDEINERKRFIKVIKPSYIAAFITSYEAAQLNG
jgi:hypothetical protein